MSGDSPLVDGRTLEEFVRGIVADVLVVAPEEVRPGAALIRDLGAESIDFMDLVFRLEEGMHTRIPYTRWQQFLEGALAGRDPSVAITPETIEAFARQVAGE
jgi:acyl carrier protein